MEGSAMEKKKWEKTVLSMLFVAASFLYCSVAQGGVPPPFNKNFAPNTVNTGATSTLTFTINGPSLPALSSLAFTDNLPAGVVIASPANATTMNCSGGTLTATAGASVISYTGGSVAMNTTCTISVDTTSSTVGAHVNTSSTLAHSFGTSPAAIDTLTVNAIAIPTLPQWGMILLTLSLLTMATWQLAGRPVLVGAGSSGTVAILPNRRQRLTSLLLGQGIATLSLLLYAGLIAPLVPHDGIGAFLAGILIGVMLECYRRGRSL